MHTFKIVYRTGGKNFTEEIDADTPEDGLWQLKTRVGSTAPMMIVDATPDENAQRQIDQAREKGLSVVRHTTTFEYGWTTGRMNHGFHYIVRWAGRRFHEVTTKERVEHINFI